jgi:ATP-dependent Clp protease, protease subunit
MKQNSKTNNYLYSICGEISWNLARETIDDIYAKYTEDQFNHLVVILASPGGDLDSGWAIYSTIRHLGVKTSTIANGRLYSAGVIAYLAGDKRYVYPGSVFLFHPTVITASGVEDRAAYKAEEEVNDFKMDDKLFRNLLETNLTKATKKDINRLTHKYKSYFVDAKEAVRIGLADSIINNINEV